MLDRMSLAGGARGRGAPCEQGLRACPGPLPVQLRWGHIGKGCAIAPLVSKPLPSGDAGIRVHRLTHRYGRLVLGDGSLAFTELLPRFRGSPTAGFALAHVDGAVFARTRPQNPPVGGRTAAVVRREPTTPAQSR